MTHMMQAAFAFAAEDKVRAGIELQPLSATSDVFGRPRRGEIAARVVIEFAAA
jgi:alcohol dehydrogenase, propanol-preferring